MREEITEKFCKMSFQNFTEIIKNIRITRIRIMFLNLSNMREYMWQNHN